MTIHVLFNPGPDALLYTADGRSVDAQDRIEAAPDGPVVKALLARGALVDLGPVDEPAATPDLPATVPDVPARGDTKK
jgi:hypothetical protein